VQRAQVKADRLAKKIAEAKRTRECRREAKRRKRRLAKVKVKHGLAAARAVARWAFDRKHSAGAVAWSERVNWPRRMLRGAAHRTIWHLVQRLGSEDLAKQYKKDYPTPFWEECARYIFVCYWKTGDRPPEQEIRERCGFDLN
jgi:hypothetical protein